MADKYNLKVPQNNEWTTFKRYDPLLYRAKAARDADQPDLAKQPIIELLNGIKRIIILLNLSMVLQ